MKTVLLLITLLAAAPLANAATFTVTNNADSGAGSLRRIIRDANLAPGSDVITFDLPSDARTILVQSPLPKITNAVVIDGSTQPGVKLIGPGQYIGLEIDAPRTTIRGIAIKDFEQGIRISSGRNSRVEACNIIGNSLWGVALEGGSNHTIIANIISGNRIGISDGFGSRGTNFVLGNNIGVGGLGTNVLGNYEYGIWGAGYSHLVIGDPETPNVISGNGTGIELKLLGGIPSVIRANFVGTDRTGTVNLGNTWDGINLGLGFTHVGGVESGAGNVIAFNGRSGVIADPPTWIQGNRIFANGLLGIDHANDHYPVLSHAIASPSSTLIVGAMIGIPQTTYRVEFFANDTCDPSGFGEGQYFLGFTTAVADDAGNAPFTFDFPEALPIPSVVTATATSLQDGTSRFSRCQPVVSSESIGLSVSQTDHPDAASVHLNVTYTITVSNTGPSWATNVILESVFPYQAQSGFVQVQPSRGSCSNSFDRTVCSLGDLNPGGWASATITIAPASPGYYTNRATVTSASPDGSLADNVSEEVTAVGLADLGVTLSMSAPPYRAGEPFPLTLHLTNAGPGMAEIAYIYLYGSSVALFPSSIQVTNLEAGGSRDMAVSAVPLTNSYFSIHGSVSITFFQRDLNPTNDFSFLSGFAQPGPGVLTLERDTYAIQENGRAILRVLRVGGAAGTLSVAYTTSNGTASANSDYIPRAGQLIFPAGKTEARIEVPLIADQTPECNEFFAVHLSAADERTVLGLTTSALISIAERPPNLAGYIRPITVSANNPRLLVGGSSWPGVSADGRKVIFTSYAREIVDPPLVSGTHVFIRDLETRTTLQLSGHPANVSFVDYRSPALSGNGNIAAFSSFYWSNGYYSGLIVRDVASGSNLIATTRSSSESLSPLMISSNGATVVLTDSSNHLHALDVPTGSNHLISAAHDGTLAINSYAYPIRVSDDGRFVLFQSYGRLLTNDLNADGDIYLRDLITQSTRLVTVGTNGLAIGSVNGADMSADGRWIAFAAYGQGIAPEVSDWGGHIYLRDMLTGTTRLVSTNTQSGAYSPQISADGQFIAYYTFGGRADVFLYDTQSGTSTLVTRSCSGQADGYSPRLSRDGRFVFFESNDIDFGDGEFLPIDNNIFRWDRLTGQTTLISVNKGRTGGARDWQTLPALSHDGNLAALISDSADLAFGDNNRTSDVFVWQAGTLPRLNISLTNQTVRITWPIDSPPAVLEMRTPESSWASVTGSIQEADGRYIYEAPTDAAAVRFYQLTLP